MHEDGPNADLSAEDDDLDLGQSPAFFVLHLSAEEAPTPQAMRAKIAEIEPEAEDVSLEGAPSAEEFGGLWQFAVHPPGYPMPMLLRLEEAPSVEGMEGLPVSLDGVKWAFIVEAWLDPEDPADTYARIGRLLSKLDPDSPALLDLDTGTWYPADMRAHLFLDLPAEAVPTELLYTLRAIAPDEGSANAAGGGWLLSAGLSRCGLPELEMFGVSEDHVDAAAGLLASMAEMLIGTEPPEPGDRMEVSDGCEVLFRLIEEVLDRLPAGAAGSRETRMETGEQWRLAVCGTEASSEYGPPTELLDALSEGEIGLYLSEAGLDRKTVGAHARWPEVAKAFASCGGDGTAEHVQFFAKVRVNGNHHWGRIVGIADTELTVELGGEGAETAPSRHVCPLKDLSDWRIGTADGEVFEAPVTLGLAEAIAHARQGAGA